MSKGLPMNTMSRISYMLVIELNVVNELSQRMN